jgi:hypothetical protein
MEDCDLRHSPPRLHLVCGRDGRLHRADIERGHYEYNARCAGLHCRLAGVDKRSLAHVRRNDAIVPKKPPEERMRRT